MDPSSTAANVKAVDGTQIYANNSVWDADIYMQTTLCFYESAEDLLSS